MTDRTRRNHSCLRLWLYGLAVAMTVLVYNIWMVCCGQCTMSNLLTIPWVGWGLLAANLLAGLTLLVLHKRNRKRTPRTMCPACQENLRQEWLYCPSCGSVRT